MGLQMLAPIHFTNFRLQRGLNPGPKGRGPQTSQVDCVLGALVGTDIDGLGVGARRKDPSVSRGESKLSRCRDAGADDPVLARWSK